MSTETTETTPTETTDATTDRGDQGMADFEAGFNDDDSTATTPPSGDDEDGQQTGSTDTTDGGEAEQKTDTTPEYVQLTRAELDDLRARAALIDEIKATQSKSFGTMGGTIREIREQINAIRSGKRIEIEQGEIDELRKDGFEAHAKALEKLRDLQVIAGPSADDLDKQVNERVEAGIKAYQQKQEAKALRRVHPDWETYQTAPDFENWVKAQPKEFQQRLYEASLEWDSDVIAEAMTKAKAAAKAAADARAKPSTKQQQQQRQPSRAAVLETAIQPRGTGRAATTPRDQSAEQAMLAGYDEG